MNRPAGSTPGPQQEDLGTREPGDVGSDGRDGRDAEIDETDRERPERARRRPDGYEPL